MHRHLIYYDKLSGAFLPLKANHSSVFVIEENAQGGCKYLKEGNQYSLTRTVTVFLKSYEMIVKLSREEWESDHKSVVYEFLDSVGAGAGHLDC